MKKKKLLIVVGAGASIDFGLPSVSVVDQRLCACAQTIYPLSDDGTSSLYEYCRDAIESYYSGSPKSELRKRVNFEEVLYQLNLLSQYLSDADRLHGSNALMLAKCLPDVLESGQTVKNADGNVLRELANRLIDNLVDEFIDNCATAATQKTKEISELRTFLTELQNKFDIGIVTLNYDNIFTQAMSSLHTGFDDKGNFDPMSVLARTDWGFIYHLHGSVHFAMTGVAYDMHGITWREVPAKDDCVHSSGRNRQDSMEGTAYPISPFVAGYGKTQQILRQPFRTYFAALNRLVHEADSLLFLGYGFSDLHLNAAFSDVRDRRRPIVVVDWANDGQDPLPFRQDEWSCNLFKTLPGNARDMSFAGHSVPACLHELRAHCELEISINKQHPLAVWYNGMLGACRHPDKILAHL